MAKQSVIVKWIIGVVSVLFTSLILGFGGHLERQSENHGDRISALEKSSIADSVDTQYIKKEIGEISDKLDVLIKEK